MSEPFKHGPIELRLGDWREVLADVEACDAVITDPPYDERTHAGNFANATEGGRRFGYTAKVGSDGARGTQRRAIAYDAWGASEAQALADHWLPRCRAWAVVMTDHNSIPTWDRIYAAAGRVKFAPVVWVSPGSRVRLAGDGPSSWCVYLMVARPRSAEMAKWGTLPGAYVTRPERGMIVVGGKPLDLMRAVVRDYTRPGDLVVDPCAGGGTTLIAAAIEGRRAIGAEIDPETYAKACARIARGYTPDLFSSQATTMGVGP